MNAQPSRRTTIAVVGVIAVAAVVALAVWYFAPPEAEPSAEFPAIGEPFTEAMGEPEIAETLHLSAAWECGFESDELAEFFGTYGEAQSTSFRSRAMGMTREQFNVLVTSFAERCR